LLKLDRRLVHGEVEVTAILSGTVGEVPHRYLGQSSSWTVLIDQHASQPLKGGPPVKWIDFSEREDLQGYADQLFYVDMSGALPAVYLNKRIEGLPVVLPTYGEPPEPLRPMYETLRTSIARSVWMALLEASLAGIIVSEKDDSTEEPAWPEIRWQHDVLRMILPKVYPVADETEALRRAATARPDEH
jgi:hypothetical protein